MWLELLLTMATEWGGGTLIAQKQANYDGRLTATHTLLIYWGDLNEINKTV